MRTVIITCQRSFLQRREGGGIVRRGISSLLEVEADITVVGQAGTGRPAGSNQMLSRAERAKRSGCRSPSFTGCTTT